MTWYLLCNATMRLIGKDKDGHFITTGSRRMALPFSGALEALNAIDDVGASRPEMEGAITACAGAYLDTLDMSTCL